jgi:methylmalonyl-CoA carboxyltransferase small subunit
LKLKIGIDGSEYVVDIEVLEDDTAPEGYFPPHGQMTTVRPVPLEVPPPEAVPAGEGADESKICRSPVAGVVMKVNIQAGQELQVNDPMLVLEAMKMETNVTAPISGKVKKVYVAQGDGVKTQQTLVEFE